jgi:hypothetical protein
MRPGSCARRAKKNRHSRFFLSFFDLQRLTLAGFETGIRFADHKDLAAATDDLAVTVAGLGRLKRIQDFHGNS